MRFDEFVEMFLSEHSITTDIPISCRTHPDFTEAVAKVWDRREQHIRELEAENAKLREAKEVLKP